MAKSLSRTSRNAIKHFVTNGHSLKSGIDIRYILPPGYINVKRFPAASRNPEQKPFLKIYFIQKICLVVKMLYNTL